ncbi:MAG: PadR family transcriptional regulator [Solirubrobacteraceae bacterium]
MPPPALALSPERRRGRVANAATNANGRPLLHGVLEFCVLALLRDGERYSYELVRALSDAEGLVTTEGTLYPLLGRLRRRDRGAPVRGVLAPIATSVYLARRAA